MVTAELDEHRIREQLIVIFERYLKDPDDVEMLIMARTLYTKYHGAFGIMNKILYGSIDLLEHIVYDHEPPTREIIESHIASLKRGQKKEK